jgi:hypothetical protein
VKSQISSRCEWMLRQEMSHTRSCVKQFKTTKIISHCFKSESIHNKMLLEQWRKATLSKDTECHSQNLFVQNWFSIHMTQQWLNTQKKCNWCSLSWQFFWLKMLQNVCTFCEIVTNVIWTTAEKMLTRLLEAFICIEANLTEDIHWLCSRSTVKWGLYEPSDNYRLS